MACHVRKMQTRDNYLHTSADMARHVPTFMIMKHPLSSAESEGFLLRKRCAVTNPPGDLISSLSYDKRP